MSEEEIKKIAKREFINNVMENLDSALIFTYIQNLEQKLQQKENIIKDIKSQLEYLETYSSKEDVFEDMKRRLDRIESIVNRK